MCSRCNDTGWICEQHPEKPMNHDGDMCPGPGVPCPDCREIKAPNSSALRWPQYRADGVARERRK